MRKWGDGGARGGARIARLRHWLGVPRTPFNPGLNEDPGRAGSSGPASTVGRERRGHGQEVAGLPSGSWPGRSWACRVLDLRTVPGSQTALRINNYSWTEHETVIHLPDFTDEDAEAPEHEMHCPR